MNRKSKLRFKGFIEDWEERKLEEVFNMSISNNTLSRSELTYENGEIYNIHYGDILVNYGSIINLKRDILPFIKDSTSELYKNQMLYNGDIIFADTAEDETVGKAVEITDVEEKIVVSGLHTIVCRPFEKKAKYYKGGLNMRKIICFHNPDEENGYLSNWYLSKFIIDNITFTSMEQYMMYKKAICFDDKAIATQILDSTDVSYIKKLGRSVSGYDDNYWNGVRQIIVYEGLCAKFFQDNKLKKKLKSTGNALLAECAVKDRIWGIGLSMTDPNRFEHTKWLGQNLLGYALMLVRDRI